MFLVIAPKIPMYFGTPNIMFITVGWTNKVIRRKKTNVVFSSVYIFDLSHELREITILGVSFHDEKKSLFFSCDEGLRRSGDEIPSFATRSVTKTLWRNQPPSNPKR